MSGLVRTLRSSPFTGSQLVEGFIVVLAAHRCPFTVIEDMVRYHRTYFGQAVGEEELIRLEKLACQTPIFLLLREEGVTPPPPSAGATPWRPTGIFGSWSRTRLLKSRIRSRLVGFFRGPSWRNASLWQSWFQAKKTAEKPGLEYLEVAAKKHRLSLSSSDPATPQLVRDVLRVLQPVIKRIKKEIEETFKLSDRPPVSADPNWEEEPPGVETSRPKVPVLASEFPDSEAARRFAECSLSLPLPEVKESACLGRSMTYGGTRSVMCDNLRRSGLLAWGERDYIWPGIANEEIAKKSWWMFHKDHLSEDEKRRYRGLRFSQYDPIDKALALAQEDRNPALRTKCVDWADDVLRPGEKILPHFWSRRPRQSNTVRYYDPSWWEVSGGPDGLGEAGCRGTRHRPSGLFSWQDSFWLWHARSSHDWWVLPAKADYYPLKSWLDFPFPFRGKELQDLELRHVWDRASGAVVERLTWTWRDVYVDFGICNLAFREAIHRCLGLKGDFPPASVSFIAEPLKYRSVTKTWESLQVAMKPLQHSIRAALLRFPPFRLVGKSVNAVDLLDLGAYERGLGEKQYCASVDYQGATDNISRSVALAVLEEVISPLEEDVRVLARHSLGGKWLRYPGGIVEDLKTTNGTLMGDILSFPFLCLLNYATYLLACEEQGLRGRRNAVLVNGDDMLFWGPQSLIEAQRRIANSMGLLFSPGKSHVSTTISIINSELFWTPQGGDLDPLEVSEKWTKLPIGIRRWSRQESPYVSWLPTVWRPPAFDAGAFLGKSKLCGENELEGDDDDESRYDPLPDLLRTGLLAFECMNNTEYSHMAGLWFLLLPSDFVRHTKGRNLFAHPSLGGFGFPRPPGFRTWYTDFQLKLAGVMWKTDRRVFPSERPQASSNESSNRLRSRLTDRALPRSFIHEHVLNSRIVSLESGTPPSDSWGVLTRHPCGRPYSVDRRLRSWELELGTVALIPPPAPKLRQVSFISGGTMSSSLPNDLKRPDLGGGVGGSPLPLSPSTAIALGFGLSLLGNRLLGLPSKIRPSLAYRRKKRTTGFAGEGAVEGGLAGSSVLSTPIGAECLETAQVGLTIAEDVQSPRRRGRTFRLLTA